MTKKTGILILFLIITPILFYTIYQFRKVDVVCLNVEKECECIGDEIFNQKVDECLDRMEFIAKKHSAKGVAVIAFIPGGETKYWNSRMRVIGRLSTQNHNFLAVASAKSAEMALTLKSSGTVDRKPLIGELGYKGGVIKKLSCGYLIASFSGASAEIDAEISNVGVDFLLEYY